MGFAIGCSPVSGGRCGMEERGERKETERSVGQLGAVADEQTFLYATSGGTPDASGRRCWNADDACCDFFATGVDDAAYLNAMIDDILSKYTVDPKRIVVVG